ncbi:hypothetical protein PCANC_09758 [Puccinia coronata f. sp. avenae]|uniref:Uncharacterized protein n=1 Tax=Puccinia coronata f. sp. avenae TaxID=200324 RepID=A0A2N5VT71_9BASI|nr:hypothetical protein PCANC_09758 [Puccinia coronata f. sp. avenae]
MSGPPNHNLPAAGDRVYAGYSYNTKSHWHPYHNPLDLNPLATDLGYGPVTNRYHPYLYQSEELPPIYGQNHSNTQPTLHTARKSGSDGCIQVFIRCGHPIQTRARATE